MKREHQPLLMMTFLSPVPELAIATLVSLAGGGWSGFWITLALLYLAYFLVWLRKTVWSWVLFRWWGRKVMVDTMVIQLEKMDYPPPPYSPYAAIDYFPEIATEEGQPIATRLHAAQVWGIVDYLESAGHLIEKTRLVKSYDEALMAYRNKRATKGL